MHIDGLQAAGNGVSSYGISLYAQGVNKAMIKVGILGSTGYAGAELVRLLLSHPEADIVWFGSRSYIDETYSGIFRNLYGLTDALCREDDPETLDVAERRDLHARVL